MGQGGSRAERRAGGRHRSRRRALSSPREGARGRPRPAGLAMTLLVEDRGAVRILTLNRPEKRNALNTDLTSRLLNKLRESDKEEGVGCIVLTGAGPGFCAGADLSEFKELK